MTLTDTTASVFNRPADKDEAYDPTGQTCYMRACEMLQVFPASNFLRHLQNEDLSMMYRGLGPQVIQLHVRDCLKMHQVTIFTEKA